MSASRSGSRRLAGPSLEFCKAPFDRQEMLHWTAQHDMATRRQTGNLPCTLNGDRARTCWEQNRILVSPAQRLSSLQGIIGKDEGRSWIGSQTRFVVRLSTTVCTSCRCHSLENSRAEGVEISGGFSSNDIVKETQPGMGYGFEFCSQNRDRSHSPGIWCSFRVRAVHPSSRLIYEYKWTDVSGSKHPYRSGTVRPRRTEGI
jgi:hypothetical protein